MKSHLSIILLVLSLHSLVVTAQTRKIKNITFTTLTRGAHQDVSISEDCVAIAKQSLTDAAEKKSKYKISKAAWNELIQALDKVTIDEIPSYASPTNKRAYDGAWHSTIIINTTAGESFRHSFDDEDPDERLEPVMAAIKKIIDRP